MSKSARPRSVTAMVFFTLVGWIATVASWIPVITVSTPLPASWPQSYTGLIWGFVASDFIWSQGFSALAVVGLWRMKSWGWACALMVNTIWIYTMTFSIVRAFLWQMSFEIFLFTPFTVYAVVASVYLWKIRDVFWKNPAKGDA